MYCFNKNLAALNKRQSQNVCIGQVFTGGKRGRRSNGQGEGQMDKKKLLVGKDTGLK
jgi:hypothetical protein